MERTWSVPPAGWRAGVCPSVRSVYRGGDVAPAPHIVDVRGARSTCRRICPSSRFSAQSFSWLGSWSSSGHRPRGPPNILPIERRSWWQ